MKFRIVFILSFCLLKGLAQDKVYLLSGECLEGTVLEVNPGTVLLESDSGPQILEKNKVLLIAYRNGLVEQYNEPLKSVMVRAGSQRGGRPVPLRYEIQRLNLLSMNSLALVNADLSFFYERLTANKGLGAGVMAAYNINQNALIYNAHFFFLNNARKNYDAGAFINIYPRRFLHKRTFYYGLMLKYTSLSFTSIREDTTGTGAVNLHYAPASGAQLATIFTLGTQIRISEKLFIRTVYGIGGFNLKGIYREQYNYLNNRGWTGPGPPPDTRFKLKLYFGFNAGYTF